MKYAGTSAHVRTAGTMYVTRRATECTCVHYGRHYRLSLDIIQVLEVQSAWDEVELQSSEETVTIVLSLTW